MGLHLVSSWHFPDISIQSKNTFHVCSHFNQLNFSLDPFLKRPGLTIEFPEYTDVCSAMCHHKQLRSHFIFKLKEAVDFHGRDVSNYEFGDGIGKFLYVCCQDTQLLFLFQELELLPSQRSSVPWSCIMHFAIFSSTKLWLKITIILTGEDTQQTKSC